MERNEEAGAAFYYNGPDQRVYLEEDANLFAVRYLPGRRADDEALSDASRRALREESEHTAYIPQYNLQVYSRTRGDQAIAEDEEAVSLARQLRSLNDEEVVEFASPVFRRSPDPIDVVFVNNRFVVGFVEGVEVEEAEAHIEAFSVQNGVRIVRRLDYALPQIAFLLETPHGAGPLGPMELSRRCYEESNGIVAYAVPDLIQRRTFKSAPAGNATIAPIGVREERDGVDEDGWTYRDEQWHLTNARVTDAWATFGQGNNAIMIAVCDDGVDVIHPEFADKVVRQFDFAAGIANAAPKSAIDKHGTACAGVAAAAGVSSRGAAPACSLMAVRFPEMLGAADEAEMFQWMADQGADVISCSWGPPDGTGAIYPLPANVRSAIRYCVTQGRGGRGTPVVWAAGNGSELVSDDGYAANPDVIAVAASTDHETQAYYSDFGPEISVCAPSSGRKSNGERRIFTADRRGADGYNPGGPNAPGDRDGNYTNDFGGTSAAAPLVAGIIGLMLSENPALSAAQVKELLQITADKIGEGYDQNGHNHRFGYGRVNALRAVEAARDTDGEIAGPSIEGPEEVARMGPAPRFRINLLPNQFYAVEVATDAALFSANANDPARQANTFYATWDDPAFPTFLSALEFQLPAAVWQRLKGANELFYRMWTSDRRTEWHNYAATVPDAQFLNAPSIRIIDDA